MASVDTSRADGISLAAHVGGVLGRRGDATVARWKRYGIWQTASGREMAARIESIGRGLRATGFGDGDVAAVVGDNCLEWVLADLGIVAAGGVSAAIDPHADADAFVGQLVDCGARVLFVAGDRHLQRARRLRERCPALERLVVMHEQWYDGGSEPGVDTLAQLEAGATAGAAPGAPAGGAEAAALIVFSSGVTGPARGAVLSHRAAIAQADRAGAVLGLRADDERLVLTPLHHVLERVVGVHGALLAGTIVNFPESAETALLDLAELQPTVVQMSPRTWARLRSAIELNLAETTRLQRWAFARAISLGQRARAGGSGWTRLLARLSDRLVLAPVRERLGLARARLCLAAGAPARPATLDWFAAIDRPLADLYGMAEAGGVVRLAMAGAAEVLAEGIEIRVDDAGEVWIRGDALFTGYVDKTGPATADGWWSTGDVARQEPGGLRILGRSAHLLRGDAAPLAPFDAERLLGASPYVADAFLMVDDAGRVCARILLDQDPVVKFAQQRSIPFTHFRSLCAAPGVQAMVEELVAQVNTAIAPIRIERFSLIERSLGLGDAEVTPTLMLRRRLLQEGGRADLPVTDPS